MTISSIWGFWDGPKSGMWSEIGENTLANCWLRASAFSFGAEQVLPSLVSVETPLLSVLVFLMNLYKVLLLFWESSEIFLARNCDLAELQHFWDFFSETIEVVPVMSLVRAFGFSVGAFLASKQGAALPSYPWLAVPARGHLTGDTIFENIIRNNFDFMPNYCELVYGPYYMGWCWLIKKWKALFYLESWRRIWASRFSVKKIDWLRFWAYTTISTPLYFN